MVDAFLAAQPRSRAVEFAHCWIHLDRTRRSAPKEVACGLAIGSGDTRTHERTHERADARASRRGASRRAIGTAQRTGGQATGRPGERVGPAGSADRQCWRGWARMRRADRQTGKRLGRAGRPTNRRAAGPAGRRASRQARPADRRARRAARFGGLGRAGRLAARQAAGRRASEQFYSRPFLRTARRPAATMLPPPFSEAAGRRGLAPVPLHAPRSGCACLRRRFATEQPRTRDTWESRRVAG